MLSISACSKKDNKPLTTPANNTSDVFLNFTLDGDEKSFTTNNVVSTISFIGQSVTASGFQVLDNYVYLRIRISRDSITGADLKSLVGMKLPIGRCGICQTYCDFVFAFKREEYSATEYNNTFPNEYVKLTEVVFQKTVTKSGKTINQYKVNGEFNSKISFRSDSRSVTSGTFSLPFREVKQ